MNTQPSILIDEVHMFRAMKMDAVCFVELLCRYSSGIYRVYLESIKRR